MADLVCGACDTAVVVAEGDYLIQCSICKVVYHDKDTACSPVAYKSWRESSPNYRKSWVGVCCRKRKGAVNNTNTKHRRNSTEEDDLMDKMAKLLDTKLEPILVGLGEMRATVEKHSESLSTLTKRMDVVEKNISEGVNGADSEEIQRLQNRVFDLELKLEATENYSRRENVVFTGIPYTEGEDPFEVAIRAASLVKVQIQRSDIVDCHRLPTSDRSRPAAFVVKFVCRHTKRNLIEAYRQNKPTAGMLGGENRNKVFANDHYAPYTSALYREARKALGAKKVECRNGVVYLKATPTSARQRIYNHAHIGELSRAGPASA